MTQQAMTRQGIDGTHVQAETLNGPQGTHRRTLHPQHAPNRVTLHPQYATHRVTQHPQQVAVRTTLHPRYVARRRSDGRSLAHHALGTLLVLGALVLMANA